MKWRSLFSSPSFVGWKMISTLEHYFDLVSWDDFPNILANDVFIQVNSHEWEDC